MNEQGIAGTGGHVPGAAVCDRCGRDIDLSWNFCAQCGEDNRAPERRQDPVPKHVHQTSSGPFCVVCGTSNRAVAQASPNALAFGPSPWYRLLGVLKVCLGLWMIWDLLYDNGQRSTRHIFSEQYALPGAYVMAVLLVIVGYCVIGWVRTGIVDPTGRQVFWNRGVWPFVFHFNAPFQRFGAVMVRPIWHSGRWSGYHTYRLQLMMTDGMPLYLCELRDPDVAVSMGQTTADTMAVPFGGLPDRPTIGTW